MYSSPAAEWADSHHKHGGSKRFGGFHLMPFTVFWQDCFYSLVFWLFDRVLLMGVGKKSHFHSFPPSPQNNVFSLPTNPALGWGLPCSSQLPSSCPSHQWLQCIAARWAAEGRPCGVPECLHAQHCVHGAVLGTGQPSAQPAGREVSVFVGELSELQTPRGN